MTRWSEVEVLVPVLAEVCRARLASGRHKTVATLRRDGSPRISGIETEFRGGELTLGMMPGSVKRADVERDPRAAVHSPCVDPVDGSESQWPGEAKVAGRLAPFAGVDDVFALDVTELVMTRIGEPADHLVVESWTPDRGYRRVERR